MPEELTLVRCNKSCLWLRAARNDDWQDWMVRLLPNLHLQLHIVCERWLTTVLHSYWLFMESLSPVYYRKGSSKGEKSFRAVWGLQYTVCCGDNISAVSIKWSRRFNGYAHAAASENPQVPFRTGPGWLSVFSPVISLAKEPKSTKFIPILYILDFSHFADAYCISKATYNYRIHNSDSS